MAYGGQTSKTKPFSFHAYVHAEIAGVDSVSANDTIVNPEH